ncbi:hypothetical protein F2P81_002599 [Scophthalmus maximus]|uniref:Uncharacterized protein n=1 Tax=Scophthalmus maximus TaxID=52904 RepID=A0A6A4TR46_SCOMX|nr:hypothetical protein F2P81_002599 [Scophthalmus maximus]
MCRIPTTGDSDLYTVRTEWSCGCWRVWRFAKRRCCLYRCLCSEEWMVFSVGGQRCGPSGSDPDRGFGCLQRPMTVHLMPVCHRAEGATRLLVSG